MISMLFIILASICNAVMDITSFQFHKSVFKDLNKYIWYPKFSWRNKYIDFNFKKGRAKWGPFKIPVQLTDSWHFLKMLMIIFICTSIVTYDFEFIVMLNSLVGLPIPLNWIKLEALGLYGLLWNVPFSLFYDKVLRK